MLWKSLKSAQLKVRNEMENINNDVFKKCNMPNVFLKKNNRLFVVISNPLLVPVIERF